MNLTSFFLQYSIIGELINLLNDLAFTVSVLNNEANVLEGGPNPK